jgi:hypothetical protein
MAANRAVPLTAANHRREPHHSQPAARGGNPADLGHTCMGKYMRCLDRHFHGYRKLTLSIKTLIKNEF